MTRIRLNNRHASITTMVEWPSSSGALHKFIVTFGVDEEHQIKEVFCASFKATSDVVSFANDACILLSRLLQSGDRIQDLVHTLSENRNENQSEGPPASPLGAIVRKGVEIENA